MLGDGKGRHRQVGDGEIGMLTAPDELIVKAEFDV
jgi:hypothetical protein